MQVATWGTSDLVCAVCDPLEVAGDHTSEGVSQSNHPMVLGRTRSQDMYQRSGKGLEVSIMGLIQQLEKLQALSGAANYCANPQLQVCPYPATGHTWGSPSRKSVFFCK